MKQVLVLVCPFALLMAAACLTPQKDVGGLPFDARVRSIVGVWDGYVDRNFSNFRTYIVWDAWQAGGDWWVTLEHEARPGSRFNRQATDVDGKVVLGPWVGLGNVEIRMIFHDARRMTASFAYPSGRVSTGVFERTSSVVTPTPPSRPVDAPPPVATPPSRPAAVAVKPPRPEPLAQPYPNSWALVIGVDAYQKGLPRLHHAVADARTVADALPGLGFPREHTRVLLDNDATRARIGGTLYRDFAHMGPDDRLLVYFAGHGETVSIRGGEEGYLLPVDADPGALPLTAIPMDEVRRISQRLRAKHYLFVLDAYFSGFAISTPSRHGGEPEDRWMGRQWNDRGRPRAIEVAVRGRRRRAG